jgi:hypothetical protein
MDQVIFRTVVNTFRSGICHIASGQQSQYGASLGAVTKQKIKTSKTSH